MMIYKQYIKEYKDFPIDGINYLDLNPIYKDGDLLRTLAEDCVRATRIFDFDYIDTYDNRVDIMVEAKAKELAVLKYKEIHEIV